MGVEAALIGAGASLIGSSMAGSAAKSAANTSANAQLESARIAAEAQKFRPVGMTTRFGTSNFQMSPEGYLTSAGYTASPEIQALQNRLSNLYGASLGTAEQAAGMQQPISQAASGLFSLGQQYLGKTPEATARDYYNQQQALLQPTRQAEEARLQQSVFGRGRAGLNVGGVNPDLASYAASNRMQDMQLAAAAEQAAQQRIGFGQGLLGGALGLQGSGYGLQTQALSPFQTQFGVTQLLEQAAQQPLDIGAQLGGRSATAGANVGQTLLQGGLGAAQTRLQGALVGPSAMMGNLSSMGNQLMQAQQQQNLMNTIMNTPNQWYSPSYGGGAQFISPATASNLNYWSGFGNSANDIYNSTYNMGEF